MFRYLLLGTAIIAAILTVDPAHALPRVPHIITFHNATAIAVHIIVDTNRQEMDVPGGGVVTITVVNVGDAPSVHVKVGGKEVDCYTFNFPLFFGKTDLTWTGSGWRNE